MPRADRAVSPPLPVYLLAGGQSRRFGSDKARAVVSGELLIERIARELAPIASRVTVVARETDAFADLGLRTLADERTGAGPLAGIERALLDLDDAPWLLVSACDFVGLQPRWLEALLQARHADAQVVAYRGERWWPLPSLWHASTLDSVRQSLDAGKLALWRVIEQLTHVAVAPPRDWERAINVNRPTDLESFVTTSDRR